MRPAESRPTAAGRAHGRLDGDIEVRHADALAGGGSRLNGSNADALSRFRRWDRDFVVSVGILEKMSIRSAIG
jgi:hypothetical protein